MREVTAPAEIKGLKGNLWVLGIDTDRGSDGCVKCLDHNFANFVETAHGGWPQLDQFLCGLFRTAERRVFFDAEAETDQFGIPVSAELIGQLNAAILEVASATNAEAKILVGNAP